MRDRFKQQTQSLPPYPEAALGLLTALVLEAALGLFTGLGMAGEGGHGLAALLVTEK